MKKFWFVAYAHRRLYLGNGWNYKNTITEVHPLQWYEEEARENEGEAKLRLLFWRELDEDLGDTYWEMFQ